MSLPMFSSDDIRDYSRPFVSKLSRCTVQCCNPLAQYSIEAPLGPFGKPCLALFGMLGEPHLFAAHTISIQTGE